MEILILSNLYPNRLEEDRATFNKSQFCAFSHLCNVRVIAQIAWTNKVFLKNSKGESIPHREIIDGIDIYHPTYYFTPKIFHTLYGIFCFLSIYPTAARLIKTIRPDCIFASWAYPDGFAAVLLGRLYNLPVFIKVHGSDIHSIGSGFVSYLTAWTLKKARKVFSVSRDLGLRMCQMGLEKDKMIVIYNGIDPSRFLPRNKTEARKILNVPLRMKVLLYIGNLVKVKGPDVLIDAFNLLRSDRKSLMLYIVGSGSLTKALQEKCRLYGIEKSVVFIGHVNHEKIDLWMNVADLLVVPSRNEGVPNVILEAMASGVPVVATKVGGIPEVIVENETGFLVKADDPSELASTIGKGLEKKWDSKAILNQSEKFSWKKNASLVMDYIKRECELAPEFN